VLAHAHLHSDPPDPGEMRAAREAAAEAFAGVGPPPVELALAVGGSATSLRRLVGPVLAEDTLGDGLEAICDAPSLEIADRLGLDEERVRLLPAGMLVLAEVSRLFATPLEIALGGLREGVVLEAGR
jgi:exopolyphosphatase / guanosine-5'-triphosphate,3'-diphosphate pyrophosphatase